VSSEAEHDEELLQLLYLCPIAIAQIDGSGRILLMNAAGSRLLMPVAPGGVIENLFDLFRVAAPEIDEMVRRYEHRSGRICDEYRVLMGTTHGVATSRILSVTLHKIDVDSSIVVIADVTDAVLREDAIRATEARLHAVFNGVKDYGIATIDLSGAVTSWNSAAELQDGYHIEDIIGTQASALVGPSGSGGDGMAPWLARARRDGWAERDGWRVRKDGTRYWANSALSLLRDADRKPIGYSMITRDLTEQRRTIDGLRQLAMTDSLTGTLSRRAFFEAAVRQERPFREHGRQSALLMLDLDLFKDVNDTYGHQTGDEVLRAVSAAAAGELRSTDAIGRYGGEEFVVLLRGCDVPAATAVAERIRERVAATVVDAAGSDVRVTVSIGVAALGGGNGDIASTIAAADRALYEAKHAGRNRVVTSAHAA
jgi:diguanylate cyclase (GGDEF)-like protein/PAS domain S-box-containing protein